MSPVELSNAEAQSPMEIVQRRKRCTPQFRRLCLVELGDALRKQQRIQENPQQAAIPAQGAAVPSSPSGQSTLRIVDAAAKGPQAAPWMYRSTAIPSCAFPIRTASHRRLGRASHRPRAEHHTLRCVTQRNRPDIQESASRTSDTAGRRRQVRAGTPPQDTRSKLQSGFSSRR